MAKTGILQRLTMGGCSHQFSWPRRASSGEYYQVCVVCGDEYSYDWSSMRRMGRKPPATAVPPSKAQPVRWTPRARRIRFAGPVRYREQGSEAWYDAELRNVSQSGLLFVGTTSMPEGTRVEVELDMPKEICGGTGGRVRCDAQLVRRGSGKQQDVIAAQIFSYVFVNRLYVAEDLAHGLRKCPERLRHSRRHAG